MSTTRLVSAAPPSWAPSHSLPAAVAAPADPLFEVWQLWAYHTMERRRIGLPDLAINSRLWSVADRFARELADRHVLTHMRANGTPFYLEISRALGRPVACSENAAMDQVDARQAVADWMESPGHRANILGPWKLWGGAVATATDGTRFWVCDFA